MEYLYYALNIIIEQHRSCIIGDEKNFSIVYRTKRIAHLKKKPTHQIRVQLLAFVYSSH